MRSIGWHYPVQDKIAEMQLSHNIHEQGLHTNLWRAALPRLGQAIQRLERRALEGIGIVEQETSSPRKDSHNRLLEGMNDRWEQKNQHLHAPQPKHCGDDGRQAMKLTVITHNTNQLIKGTGVMLQQQ